MAKLPCPRNLCLIAGTLFLILLTACLSPSGGTTKPVARQHEWAEALRALDLVDTPTPAYDLTAVYLRRQDNLLQIRVDLLDFKSPKDLSLEIRVEDNAAPQAPPLTIRIPSQTDSFRTTLDPLLATVTIELPYSEIPSYPLVNVSTPEDEITGLTLDSPIPAGTAPLLLAFYDTFAGRFPAEALRSWDGAHTGPRGERHGLKYLLDAVEKYKIPIVLLDLKALENLSALDAMGELPRIQKLADEDLLILPENEATKTLLKAVSSPPESATQFLDMSFGLPTSPLSYKSTSTDFQFAFIEDNTHLYHPLFSKTTYLPIAAQTNTTQPTPNGPTLEMRRALLETALNADEKDLLVLGGGLRDTTWGSPDMVGVTMAYFASRPYIRMLSASDLMNSPTQSGKPVLRSMAPDEALSKLTSHYQNLTQPVLDFVASWKGSPLSSCATDLDKDTQPECVLANEDYLAIFDPQGARFTYLFAVERDGIPPYTQLIGPSWQVAVGLSNPSEWDLSMGEAADPGAFPGAFTDADDPFKPYEPIIEGNTLVFTSLDGTRTKIFKLAESGLEVMYQTQELVTIQIPLLVDPWMRFTPSWAEKYVQKNTPDGITWGLENGPIISVQFEGPIKIRAFNEALELLASPEDPDFEYPPGHYLPFPMAIVEIEMQDGYFLRLERLP